MPTSKSRSTKSVQPWKPPEPRGMVLHGVTGQRQDGSLSASDRKSGGLRPAGNRARSRDQSSLHRRSDDFARGSIRWPCCTAIRKDVERHRHWQRIARGEVQVVVGARSAVFSPTPNLGLIVIDEEHESSVQARHRAEIPCPRCPPGNGRWLNGFPWCWAAPRRRSRRGKRAVNGEFTRVSLPDRVLDRQLPDVATVDLRDPAQSRGGRGGISRPLHQAIVAALRDGGQVILLLNRRGFSTHIQCPGCGFVLKCPDCEISLTFHRQKNRALCHYCDHDELPPTECPDCKSSAIRYGGLGTQKLEDEVRARFPRAVCARMDTDSMRVRGSHEDVLSRFRQREIQILLGTQMIAKGLDFPNVTLVGVINADTALHLPDFRAGERTFQLVAQVAGRTGRGEKGGRVLVQTPQPRSPGHCRRGAARLLAIAEQELAARAELRYPPFGAMVRFGGSGPHGRGCSR